MDSLYFAVLISSQEAAVKFLQAAGMDFDRHANEGIEPKSMGALLQCSATWAMDFSPPVVVDKNVFYCF